MSGFKLWVLLIVIVLFFSPSSLHCLDPIPLPHDTELKLDTSFRSFGLNDQRIYWSGLETSFGVEANISTVVTRKFKKTEFRLEGEFMLNQPFGRNILIDELREDYHPNWQTENFKLSKLNLSFELGKFTFTFGKAKTPFGKSYFNHFSNEEMGAGAWKYGNFVV